jgi:hypothetical protein
VGGIDVYNRPDQWIDQVYNQMDLTRTSPVNTDSDTPDNVVDAGAFGSKKVWQAPVLSQLSVSQTRTGEPLDFPENGFFFDFLLCGESGCGS